MAVAEKSITSRFFDLIFDSDEGYVCLAVQDPRKGREDFRQVFFRWPQQRSDVVSFIQQSRVRHNVWFCVNLLEEGTRKKEYCLSTNLVWSDLDEVDPETIDLKPPIVIESSPGRYQALWRLNEKVEPEIAEDYSRRIAYSVGADKSGWDLTQLLRVPLTFNYKYEVEGEQVPTVKLTKGLDVVAPVELFEALPKPPHTQDPVLDEHVPDDDTLPDAQSIIYKFMTYLRDTAFLELHHKVPEYDWSGSLWREINICLEAGMDKFEVFAVVRESACNKYARDERPERYLWRDVIKAAAQRSKVPIVDGEFVPLTMPELCEEDEVNQDTFVRRYCEWATRQTDAVEEFHELVAFTLLSTVSAAGLRLNTTYGTMIPNLWAMILGDSTLTRKSTAMNMGIGMIAAIDRDLVLATDGSAEGLLTGLSTRPDKVSLFYKDEVAGLFDSFHKKDYLAGMPETLTQLYDVPPIYNRRLRKEVISITNPVFIFFGGGIKGRVYDLLSQEDVLTGFLPRFLVVSGETDIDRVRGTAPATKDGSKERDALISELTRLYREYNQVAQVKIAGEAVETPKHSEVMLTEKAWKRYQDIELTMAKEANESPMSMIALPTFERLSRSLLKMSMLLAASREHGNKVKVEESDVATAAYYVQKWGRHSIDLVMNVGQTVSEKLNLKILRAIERKPGIRRSTIMQHHHLSKKQMDIIIETLEDRAQIRVVKIGKAAEYWAL